METKPPTAIPGFESEMAQAHRQREAMDALINHFGWKLLCEVIQEHINSRFSNCIEKSSGLDELISKEHTKGEAHMAIVIRDLPTILLNDSKETIRRLTRVDEEQTDES